MTTDSNLPSSRLVADLFDENAITIWSDDDLAGVFRHLMSMEAVVALEEFRNDAAANFNAVAATCHPKITSFNDLMIHPNPPVELLQIVKSYAKGMRNHPEALLPPAIAKMLYYIAIATANLRCNQSISELSRDELRKALMWAVGQSWIEDRARAVLSAAMLMVQ